jgi:hypothetical protein
MAKPLSAAAQSAADQMENMTQDAAPSKTPTPPASATHSAPHSRPFGATAPGCGGWRACMQRPCPAASYRLWCPKTSAAGQHPPPVSTRTGSAPTLPCEALACERGGSNSSPLHVTLSIRTLLLLPRTGSGVAQRTSHSSPFAAPSRLNQARPCRPRQSPSRTCGVSRRSTSSELAQGH